MKIRILNEKEKQELEEKLNERLGIKNLPDKIIRTGKERIKLFTGNLTEKQIQKLNMTIPLESIGLYLAKEEDGKIRLSIEGSQILGKYAEKNIFQIENEEQLKDWMRGQELRVKTMMRGIVLIRYKNDFIGSGKASENKITNFIPKSRRIK